MYLPFNYEKINLINGYQKPSAVKRRNNRSYDYWWRALYQRAVSVFEWDLPEEWTNESKDFFLWALYRYGYVAVWESAKFGYTFQVGTLKGYNWHYNPTHVIINNPKWTGKLEIGKDCSVIKLTPDWFGLTDIIDYYARQLSELTADVDMALINSKVPFAVAVRNKTAGAIVRKAYDMIQAGEPAIVTDARLLLDKTDDEEAIHILDRNLAQSYITDKLLSDMRTIIGNFNTEIGIPNVGYEKKERLTNDEVNANNVETVARASIWYDCINRSLDVTNAMFPSHRIACKMREYDTADDDGQRTDESGVDS